jgi:hypothetical protein
LNAKDTDSAKLTQKTAEETKKGIFSLLRLLRILCALCVQRIYNKKAKAPQAGLCMGQTPR